MLLASALRVPWTLLGGQMVLVHALEHSQAPLRISQDGDLVADVRAQPTRLVEFGRGPHMRRMLCTGPNK